MGVDKKAVVGSQDQLLDLLYQGRTLLESHLLNDALTVFEQARELAPHNPNVLSQLAQTYGRLHRSEEAIGLYAELVESGMFDPDVPAEYGALLLGEERAEEARQVLEEALVVFPDEVKLRSKLGLAYSQLGLYEKAQQQFLEARLDHMAEKMQVLIDEALSEESESVVEVNETPVEHELETDFSVEPETRELDINDLPDAVLNVIETGLNAIETSEVPVVKKVTGTEDLMSELFSSEDNLLIPPPKPTPQIQASFPFEMADTAEIEPERLEELLHTKANYSEDEMDSRFGIVPQPEPPAPQESTHEELPQVEHLEEDGETISVHLFLPGQEMEFPEEDDNDVPFETGDSIRLVTPLSFSSHTLSAMLADGRAALPSLSNGEIQLHPNGVLFVNIADKGYARLGALDLQVGETEAKPAHQRFDGKDLPAILGPEHDPLCEITGDAFLRLAAVEGESRHPIQLTEEDALYMCSGHVVASSPSLDWENGRFPSPLGADTDLFLEEFWGDGTLVLQVEGSLEVVPVNENAKVRVLHSALVGWFGELVPSITQDVEDGPVFVDFSGTGGILLKG